MLCVWTVFTITQKLHVLNRLPMLTFHPYLWAREPLEHKESCILRKPRLWCGNLQVSVCKGRVGTLRFVTVFFSPSLHVWMASHGTYTVLASGSLLLSSKTKQDAARDKIEIATSPCWLSLMYILVGFSCDVTMSITRNISVFSRWVETWTKN